MGGEPAKRHGSGTQSYGMRGKGRALVPKLSDSSRHHTVFSVSYNSAELWLFGLNGHLEVIPERGNFREKYAAISTQKNNTFLATLHSIDFPTKGCNTSFMIWSSGLKICLASETVGTHLYHPPANCITLAEFYAFQKTNPTYICRSPHFTVTFREDTSWYLTRTSPGLNTASSEITVLNCRIPGQA